MSSAAGYPATGQSWVAPVGDACRLVKLRPRFPGMIFMDVQAAGGHRATCQEFTAGVPCRSPQFLVLGSFQHRRHHPFKQTGAAATEPGIRTEGGATSRSVSIRASYPRPPRSIANEP